MIRCLYLTNCVVHNPTRNGLVGNCNHLRPIYITPPKHSPFQTFHCPATHQLAPWAGKGAWRRDEWNQDECGEEADGCTEDPRLRTSAECQQKHVNRQADRRWTPSDGGVWMRGVSDGLGEWRRLGRKRRTGRQLWAVVAREAGWRTPSFSSRLPKLCYKACQQLLRRPHITTTCVPNSTQLLSSAIQLLPHTHIRPNFAQIQCQSPNSLSFSPCVVVWSHSFSIFVHFGAGFCRISADYREGGILGVWDRGCCGACCWRVRESLLLFGVGDRQAGSCCGVLNAVVCGLRGRGCVDCATILQQLGSAEEELGIGSGGGGRSVIGWWWGVFLHRQWRSAVWCLRRRRPGGRSSLRFQSTICRTWIAWDCSNWSIWRRNWNKPSRRSRFNLHLSFRHFGWGLWSNLWCPSLLGMN